MKKTTIIVTAVATVALFALSFVVGHHAYQLCMTADQHSPFMGPVGVMLPVVALLLAFWLGVTTTNLLNSLKA